MMTMTSQSTLRTERRRRNRKYTGARPLPVSEREVCEMLGADFRLADVPLSTRRESCKRKCGDLVAINLSTEMRPDKYGQLDEDPAKMRLAWVCFGCQRVWQMDEWNGDYRNVPYAPRARYVRSCSILSASQDPDLLRFTQRARKLSQNRFEQMAYAESWRSDFADVIETCGGRFLTGVYDGRIAQAAIIGDELHLFVSDTLAITSYQ